MMSPQDMRAHESDFIFLPFPFLDTIPIPILTLPFFSHGAFVDSKRRLRRRWAGGFLENEGSVYGQRTDEG